jgi:hypothetical protein
MTTAAPTKLPFETFTAIFGEEHRTVRDLLLELVDAFEARDQPRARRLLGELANVAGPHFRYEEESLYPALVPIFGPGYVGKLRRDHDWAIDSARTLVALGAHERLDDAEVAEAVRLARGILPHGSDCDGLSIMVELLPDATVEALLETRARALAEGLDLLAWAEGPRAAAGSPAAPD